MLDFSGNSLRRLTDRLLAGLQDTLQELHLTDNLLGDSLNPIFSSSELHGLGQLRVLNLAGNQIKGIEEGLLKGCDNLMVSDDFFVKILTVRRCGTISLRWSNDSGVVTIRELVTYASHR